jgi:hypothetical protein
MARCFCPSVGDGPVRMITHLADCRAAEDLLRGSYADVLSDLAGTRDLPPAATREPGPDEKTLADSYQRHGQDLAAIEDAYADDSWRTGWA